MNGKPTISAQQIVNAFTQLYSQSFAQRITAHLAEFDEMNDQNLTLTRCARSVGKAIVAALVDDNDKGPINPAFHHGQMKIKTQAHVITCTMQLTPSKPREKVNAVGHKIKLRIPLEINIDVEVRKRTGADDLILGVK